MNTGGQGSIDLTKDPLRLTRTGGFKSVQLNLAGWSVLVGVGLLLGSLLFLTTSVPAAVALPSAVLSTWVVLLVLDNHRWRNSKINIGRGGLDETSGRAIVAKLEAMGIEASYREDDYEGEIQRGVTCRNADAEVVRQVMDEKLS